MGDNKQVIRDLLAMLVPPFLLPIFLLSLIGDLIMIPRIT